MSQCKAYNQKPINPDLWLNVIPINCANCKHWTGERCGDETVALNMNNPKLMEYIGFCQW